MSETEHPEFRRLQAQWDRVLLEDGFTDIERAGEDGPLDDPLGPGALLYFYDSETLGTLVEASEPMLDAAFSIEAAAREALWQDDIWKGLPGRARKVWALMVIASWSVTRAASFVKADDRTAFRWTRIVRERIAERSRRG